jgi:hypothetical protein
MLAPQVAAEVIEYEIYELSNAGADPKLIAKGKREYSLKDIEVRAYERRGKQVAEKLIALEQGYRVGARILYEKKLVGFGLLAKRSNADISWEWYDKENANRFRRLHDGTLVTVRVVGAPAIEELAEITFLEPTSLRFTVGQGMADTHSVLIKAGSVLRLK